jgi:hypothetical protein
MSTAQVGSYLQACAELGIGEVHFEGGEPFLHYTELREWVGLATAMGLTAGAVTNGFWATDEVTAEAALGDLKAKGLTALMISTDDYHGGDEDRRRAILAAETARRLDIPVTVAVTNREQVMFRGRAAHCLMVGASAAAAATGAQDLSVCPHEQLDAPGRVHIDPFGHVHLCQGLTMGQARTGDELRRLIEGYLPSAHPVVGPLLRGGPLELSRVFGLGLDPDGYVDACHLCYAARKALRLHARASAHLAPGHVYGQVDSPPGM